MTLPNDFLSWASRVFCLIVRRAGSRNAAEASKPSGYRRQPGNYPETGFGEGSKQTVAALGRLTSLPKLTHHLRPVRAGYEFPLDSSGTIRADHRANAL